MAIGETNTTVTAIVAAPEPVSALLAGSVRWNTTAPGVSGTVIDWYADWQFGQIGTVKSMFAGWSDVANITFRQTTIASEAEIILQNSPSLGGGVSGLPLMAADNSPFREGGNFTDPDTGLVTASQGVVYTILNLGGTTANAVNSAGLDAFGNVAQGYKILDTSGNFTAEGYNLLFHEIGHALGLKHPHSDGPGNTDVFTGVTPNNVLDLGDNQQNQVAYTVMSYNVQSYNTSAGVVLQTVETPMAYDIAAIQLLYGAKMSTRSGDDTYELGDPFTTPSLRAIWDTAGIDQIVYNGSARAVINLRAATLDGSESGGGYQSYTFIDNSDGTRDIGDGFMIAGDVLGVLADSGTERGVVIENASGGSNDDIITGNGANNILRGNGGKDILLGLGGNDTLDGGIGADWMDGFEGNDTFIVDDVGDSVSDGGTDGGVDIVKTTLGTYSLGENIENLQYTGNNTFGGFGNSLNNVITGRQYGDFLAGLDGDDTLNGGDGADTLDGGRGSDTLNGGLGADYMAGGQDNDTYRVNNNGDRIFKSAGPLGGIDTVQTTTNSYKLDPNVENLRYDGTGQFTGIGNDLSNLIIGGERDDVLQGRDGADTLMGRQGNDKLDGGADSDTADYSFESLGVVANLSTGSASTNNGGFIDTLVSIENLTAGLGNDVFTGNAQDNRFTYVGSFLGNHENGEVVSNTGEIDTYDGGNGTDTVDFFRFAGTLSVDLSNGVASAAYSWVIDTGGQGESGGTAVKVVANLTNIENVVGSSFDDQIRGDNKANVLDGGAGIDTLRGGGDTDTFVFRDGWGRDTISDFSFTAGDRIDMSGVTGLDAFSQLTIATQGSDAVVTFGQDSIILTGVAAESVASSWFLV